MYKLKCAQIWGGIEESDATISSTDVIATLFASSGQGNKGGDIYYLTLCNSSSVTRVVIADVVGHGEIVSSMSQSFYESLDRHVDDHDGSNVLIELNKEAIKKGITALTTAIVATYYNEDRSFSYVYAGHPPMLLNRNNSHEWSQMEIVNLQESNLTNIPLAVDENASYIQESIKLDSGDRVLLYTDGLLETPSQNNEPFGMVRLLESLKSSGNKKIDVLRDEVVNALNNHAGNKLEHDDVTLLLLEIR